MQIRRILLIQILITFIRAGKFENFYCSHFRSKLFTNDFFVSAEYFIVLMHHDFLCHLNFLRAPVIDLYLLLVMSSDYIFVFLVTLPSSCILTYYARCDNVRLLQTQSSELQRIIGGEIEWRCIWKIETFHSDGSCLLWDWEVSYFYSQQRRMILVKVGQMHQIE